jgi:hypothetical protein
LEQLMQLPRAAELAEALHELCLPAHVACYHFTRAEQSDILQHGLRSRSGRQWRDAFIRRHSHHFNADQLAQIGEAWASYFNGPQRSVRDGRIWFNLTLDALDCGGADPLLTHYGGENVYMPFKRETNIVSVLQSLGTPFVVECTIPAAELLRLRQIEFGKVWLSSLHVMANPEALQFDQDIYVTDDVNPTQITRIATVRKPTPDSWRWEIEEWNEANKALLSDAVNRARER